MPLGGNIPVAPGCMIPYTEKLQYLKLSQALLIACFVQLTSIANSESELHEEIQ